MRVAGIVLLIVAAACGDRALPSVVTELRRPIVFAHRGGAGEAPEATLPALLAAAADKSTVIELDLRRSHDGHLVVIHDAGVERTTNGTGRVAAMTLGELRALDAGHCATPGRGNGTARRGRCNAATDATAFPFRGKGYQIPTLAQVLSAMPAPTILAIEVKEAGFEEQVASELRRANFSRRVIVGSANSDVASRLLRLLPEAAHYFPRAAAARLAIAAKLTAGLISRPAYHVLAVPRSESGLDLDTKRVIDAAHRRGVLVAYWTVNEETEMERLLRMGADGLFTDYPTRARLLIDRLWAAGALNPSVDARPSITQ